MKRWLAFCGSDYYPDGGWQDFLSSHDELEDAIRALLDHATSNTVNWYHIVDATTGKIVLDSKEK